MQNELILIINLGGTNNQMIARGVRENKVYCEVAPYDITIKELKEKNPKGIIFSARNIEDAKKEQVNIIKEIEKANIPVMLSENIMEDTEKEQLKDFLFEKCKCSPTWDMNDFANKTVKELKSKLKGKKVLCALSGGVDSSVAAVLIHKAIGKDLTCIFVDHGLLRKNEGDEVEKIFGEQYDMNLIRVNAQEQFLSQLEGIDDPEEKRKIIGEEFIRVFEKEAKKIGQVDFLVQGTIYPDIIESGTKDEVAVKSHHNVGGLPDHVDFKEIIEPLSVLFKDEVRDVGRALDIPEILVARQPFPGPGLAIRVIGDITKEKLDILREADFIYREEVAKAGLDKEIWQYFAVLTNLKTVGVIDNKRTYNYTVALRGVTSIDGMSADWARIPHDVLAKMSTRITSEVEGVNRVVYDITGKPPATIEWE